MVLGPHPWRLQVQLKAGLEQLRSSDNRQSRGEGGAQLLFQWGGQCFGEPLLPRAGVSVPWVLATGCSPRWAGLDTSEPVSVMGMFRATLGMCWGLQGVSGDAGQAAARG